VVPRVLALATSVFCLTIYLILIAIGSGYLFAFLQDVPLTPSAYLGQIGDALRCRILSCSFSKLPLRIVIAVVNCYHGLARPLRLEDVSR